MRRRRMSDHQAHTLVSHLACFHNASVLEFSCMLHTAPGKKHGLSQVRNCGSVWVIESCDMIDGCGTVLVDVR